MKLSMLSPWTKSMLIVLSLANSMGTCLQGLLRRPSRSLQMMLPTLSGAAGRSTISARALALPSTRSAATPLVHACIFQALAKPEGYMTRQILLVRCEWCGASYAKGFLRCLHSRCHACPITVEGLADAYQVATSSGIACAPHA